MLYTSTHFHPNGCVRKRLMTTIKNTAIRKQASTHSALWTGDLHLDQADRPRRKMLFDRIRSTASNSLIITGDVANARELVHHLTALAAACWPRPCYFAPGNHDYYNSSIGDVTTVLEHLEDEVSNFHFLNGRIIPLGRDTCLIGHGGWADARAGDGRHRANASKFLIS